MQGDVFHEHLAAHRAVDFVVHVALNRTNVHGLGVARTLVEDYAEIVVFRGDIHGFVVEFGTFHHLGVAHHGAGPSAIELFVFLIPHIEVHRRPARVFEVNGGGVGDKGLNLVVARNHFAHGAVFQQAHFQGAAVGNVHLGAACHFGARCGGFGAVEGVHQLCSRGGAHCHQFHIECLFIFA